MVLSDASGSDAEDNRSRRKKRTAVIGSGSEDSDAGAAKGSGDRKEPAGMVASALLIFAGKIHVKKTLGRRGQDADGSDNIKNKVYRNTRSEEGCSV